MVRFRNLVQVVNQPGHKDSIFQRRSVWNPAYQLDYFFPQLKGRRESLSVNALELLSGKGIPEVGLHVGDGIAEQA